MSTAVIDAPAAGRKPRSRWPARILVGVPTLFLTFDAAMKLVSHPEVIAGSERLGIPAHLAPLIGGILLVCVALYAIPRTAPIGAVLLTGYLGGAVFVHMRMGDPLLTHTLFPIYAGIIAWIGLYLRDDRVRAVLASPHH